MMNVNENNSIEIVDGDSLYDRIVNLVTQARQKVVQTANLTLVYTNFEIGRMILEEEQHGKHRAEYGQRILQSLSKRLTKKFGSGYSYPTLRRCRQFYQEFSKARSICSTPLSKLPTSPEDFTLSWSHYLILMQVSDLSARSFYEIEAGKEQWGTKELRRQIDSSLYERVALSKDKSKVLELSRKGQVLVTSKDVIKEPYVLEFLGLKEDSRFTETELETRIIDHLQDFLLELGSGFAFIGRQVRFSFDEEHYFVDLVFYNRLLRCFVLFDLKTGKLKHQDIGQMQMYVHYYDRFVKAEFENPTIGILLCKQKNEAVVKITLPENENIYAAEYKLYLPDAELLQAKLAEWMTED